jgi:hypothetical protein
MMQLVKFTFCRETVAVLRMLLHKALDGSLRGILVCYRTTDGREHILFGGIYRVHPASVLAAAEKIKAVAARQLDLFA